MKAPAFWWRSERTGLAKTLAPAGRIYGAATARRMRRDGLPLPVPVICVGNPVAGGAGKTPTALWLGVALKAEGYRPAFLSRGYGRRAQRDAVLTVDPARHDAAMAGDEPLLLAAVASTVVGRDRRATAHRAIEGGADVLILDDGLQNPTLRKTYSLAVVDGAVGVGNGACLPAGPLRAPLAEQWRFISAVLIVGEGAAGDRVAAEARRAGKWVWRASLGPDPATVEALGAMPLYAFAGIGRPRKFLQTLQRADLDVVGWDEFPDHHPYRPQEIERLVGNATALGATLVTTAKDKARLPPGVPVVPFPVTLDVIDAAELLADVMAAIGSHGL